MNSRSVILLENTDKALCHLGRGHNEVIYSLSKSTNVQIDVCTNTDERTMERMERIINNNYSMSNTTPLHDDEQSQSLFSDIYSYLSTSIVGVLFGYFFKGKYRNANSNVTIVQKDVFGDCCEDFEPEECCCRSCDPDSVPELCDKSLWCVVFSREVLFWIAMCLFLAACCSVSNG